MRAFAPFMPLVLAAVTMWHTEPALACGATPCASTLEVQPRDRATAVPLNTEIRVLYFGSVPYAENTPCEPDLRRMRLVPAGGTPVELTGRLVERRHALQTWAVAQPDEPLLANTSYEVQLEGGSAIYHCSCDEREWTTVSTFVTGDARDDTAPTFSGISGLRYGELLEAAAVCGQSKVISLTPEMVAPSDDSRHLYFNVYVDGALEKGYVSSLVHANARSDIFVDCGIGLLTGFARVAPGATLEVRAVDLAGNESAPNAPLEITAMCDPAPSDEASAPTAPLDAGAPLDAQDAGTAFDLDTATPARAELEQPSCAISSGSGAGLRARRLGFASGVGLWVLLTLSLRRRATRTGAGTRVRHGDAGP